MSKPTGWKVALGLAVAAIVAYKLSYPSYVWRQQLTIEVSTPEGPAVGSSVVEVTVAALPQILPDARNRDFDLRGEAAVVALPGGRHLFALLDGQMALASRVFRDTYEAHQGDLTLPAARAVSGLRESREVPREHYPLLVTFTDIADPKTVRRVDPDNLAATFGPGVSLERVTLEISDEAVTEGQIETILPWLEAVGRERPTLIPNPPYLEKNAADPEIQYLTPGPFSTELYK